MSVKLIHTIIITYACILGFTFASSVGSVEVPTSFEKNIGQKNEQVLFSTNGSGYAVYLTDKGMVLDYSQYQINKPHQDKKHWNSDVAKNTQSDVVKHDVLQMSFLNKSLSMTIDGIEKIEQKSNYFIGNDPAKWNLNVPHFNAIGYSNVYEGIDAKIYNKGKELEYDFIVNAGADPSQIKIRYNGAQKLSLDDQGNLVIEMEFKTIVHKAPVLFQENGAIKTKINGHYILEDENTIRFSVGSYDETKSLVIDPVIGYSTYFGGSSYDSFYQMDVGSHGITLVGETYSPDFPILNQGMDYQGDLDIVVVRLTADGKKILFSTYIGGTDEDYSYTYHGLKVDNSGSIYFTAESDSIDFPITATAYSPFGLSLLIKINSTGSELVFSHLYRFLW